MQPIDLAHSLLDGYARIFGIQNLKFDSAGCARLMFRESIPIDLEIDQAAGMLHAYSAIKATPPGEQSALFQRLLEANMYGGQTAGASFCIDSVRKDILLCRSLELASVTPAAMADILETLVNAVQYWAQELAHDAPARADAAANQGFVPPGMWDGLRG